MINVDEFIKTISNRIMYKWKRSIALSVIRIENSKTQKYDTFSMKHQFSLLFVTNMAVITIQEESIKILKILNLMNNKDKQNIVSNGKISCASNFIFKDKSLLNASFIATYSLLINMAEKKY